MKRRKVLKAVSAAVFAIAIGSATYAQTLTAKSVVLVHGAFADGSA